MLLLSQSSFGTKPIMLHAPVESKLIWNKVSLFSTIDYFLFFLFFNFPSQPNSYPQGIENKPGRPKSFFSVTDKILISLPLQLPDLIEVPTRASIILICMYISQYRLYHKQPFQISLGTLFNRLLHFSWDTAYTQLINPMSIFYTLRQK